MEKIKNGFNHVIDLMEENNRGVQLGCYSVALIGLTSAIRRVRPFSRFRQPADIPNHFIKERRELTGLVERINPNGALLMIRHKPLVALPGIPGGQLPVKISGVNVKPFGLNWLQTIVVGSEVKFVPVAKAQNFVQCQVLLPQKTRKNKQYTINVGESLVKIGFGQVVDLEKPISKDRYYLNYRNRLHVAEIYALRQKLGVKYYINPTIVFLTSVAKHLKIWIQACYKQVTEIPRMVTS